MNIEKIINKYEKSIVSSLDTENMTKIIDFLQQQNCDFIDEIVENYLDLFILDIDDFVLKYNKLNQKYKNKFLEEASFDMNKLDEFYDF